MAEVANPGETPQFAEPFLEELIEDAQLVASFGQRAGVFQDSTIFDAIHAVHSENGTAWNSKAVVKLQKALNDAVISIQPVTLVDLKQGWNPFTSGETFARHFRPTRFLYILLAVFLIAAAIHYSQWLKRAEAVVLLQEQDLGGQLDAVINEINDQFLIADRGGLDLVGPEGGPARAALREKLRQARKLAAARGNAHREYNLVTNRFYMPWAVFIERDITLLWSDYSVHKVQFGADQGTPPKLTNRLNEVCAPPGSEESKVVEVALQAKDLTDGVESDAAGVRTRAGTVGIPEKMQAVDLIRARWREDFIGRNVLRCLTNADQPLSGARYDEADLRQKIETVGLWVLPALFGAFGAVVYHLRACWNELRPDPRFGRAMLRVFLGAFGGIAFGWFWSPGGSDLLPATLPLGAYAIAFLIGYSIDIFFAFLDRLVSTVSGSIDRIGSERPVS